jgi:hypothetical protein
VNQWEAVLAAAGGTPPKQWPRTEVVLDLSSKIVALRSGDFKIIYGSIGVTDVIADEDYPCADCCPFRRSFPSHSSTNACDAASSRAAQLDTEQGAEARGPPGGASAIVCTAEAPCVYDVVHDVNESINLALDPAYNATVAMLQSRVAFHQQQAWTGPIAKTNFTAAQYCDIVRAANWVLPFGYAPPAPPPAPTPRDLAAVLEGVWMQPNREEFTIVAGVAVGVSADLVVRTLNCSGCCWESLTARARYTDSTNTSATISVSGPAPSCVPPSRALLGSITLASRTITWQEQEGGDRGWANWTKV